jgi:isoleucyl-tRNA synthetase
MYKELGTKLNLPEIEEKILKFWDQNDLFAKSISTRDKDKRFVFYEGPPTANGRPGVHHVLARTVKDLVCRYMTMQGYRVERKAGWDTHGLPVEIEVEKSLGFKTKDEVVAFGVDKFNQKCRESVWQYKEEWDTLTRRMAYWIDLSSPYVTYENNYIESVWWILSEIWKKKLLYKGHKILPYCPRCETPLSGHEVAQGYRDVRDPSIYVKMPLLNDPETFFLVWTTTPWTLISNVALALHPDLEYVLVEQEGEKLILAKSCLAVLEGEYKIRQSYKGAEFNKQHYKRLFKYIPVEKDAFYTINGEFVSAKEGTGIVHIAPAFGEDDYLMGKKYDLPFLQPVDKSGRFDDRVADYKGQFFKEADKAIIKQIEADGRLYKRAQHEHSYPHCWRCDTPLIYYARESWYIQTTKFKDRMLRHNNMIDWFPKEVGEGRFGEWLKNNIDWSLSRDRFWGTPLPIWECQACNAQECIGSIETLKRRSGLAEIKDLHKPFVDEITFPCEKCTGTMNRVPELIDVWFDSGSMPVAQWHYPFENKEIFEENFPAHFICEAVDQTRGWFYSLLAISVLLFDKPCYKSCVSLEMILDKNSQKMSKSRGNIVDPFELMKNYGADPLRWYLMAVSPLWQTTRFDEDGVKEIVSKFFGTLLNTYNFFAVYANIDKFTYKAAKTIPVAQRPEIDRWILSLLNSNIAKINEYWHRFDITRIARTLANFVLDDVSNWYVRRNRRRFWKSEIGEDKLAAYQTLYEVLHAVSRLMAPIAPILAEALYRNLAGKSVKAETSVHLDSYPSETDAPFQFRDEELESRMALVRSIVSSGHALRNDAKMKVRQPLSRLILVPHSEKEINQINQMLELIKDELNIKKIAFAENTDALMTKKAEPQFKKLGPKFGKEVNKVAGIIKAMDAEQIASLEKQGKVELQDGDFKATVTLEDIKIVAEGADNLVVSLDGELPVALDTRLNKQLISEGVAREVVNRIQNMRKEAGYAVVDRIDVALSGSEKLTAMVDNQEAYIKRETLAENLLTESDGMDLKKEFEIENEIIHLAIRKINL